MASASDNEGHKKKIQSRILMVIAALIILAMVGTLFPVMRHIAHQRQLSGAQSFAGYVRTHQLGTLVSIDSGTGVDPVSYVLTMTHRIPDNQIEAEMSLLMKQYVEDDHGQTLTVMYENPTTHKRSPIGLANYDDNRHVLALTITPSTGNERQITKKVNW